MSRYTECRGGLLHVKVAPECQGVAPGNLGPARSLAAACPPTAARRPPPPPPRPPPSAAAFWGCPLDQASESPALPPSLAPSLPPSASSLSAEPPGGGEGGEGRAGPMKSRREREREGERERRGRNFPEDGESDSESPSPAPSFIHSFFSVLFRRGSLPRRASPVTAVFLVG